MFIGLSILMAASKSDLFPFGPYDASIPTPEAILHYEAGDRQTTYREQEIVTKALADAAPGRVREISYGSSVEGRPLRVFAISSPKNIARLSDIQKWAQAQAKGLEAPKDQPVIVWINECIHGNEPASFESSMWCLYNLAASRNPALSSALEHTVVLINPSYNPDGHERFAVWSNSIAVGSERAESYEHHEPGVISGRFNHYRFDMNRDRVAMSQPETVQEVAEFLRWSPQVYVDQHGQTPNYFFPPNALSQNPNVDRARVNKWTTVFGRSNGALFDAHGWQFFVKDVYDLYYAGYLDSFTTLSGAIGMTFETDGGYERMTTRSDGTNVSLQDAIVHHLATALNVVITASKNREELLEAFRTFKHQAVTGQHAGKFRRVVVTSSDSRPLRRLQHQLGTMGIQSRFVKGYLQSAAHDFWHDSTPTSVTIPDGSLVIDMAQPQGQLAKAMLEPTGEFEPEFVKAQLEKRKQQLKEEKYPGAEGTEFYDITGWSLIYGYDLPAYWCESTPETSDWNPTATSDKIANSNIGWALRYTDEQDALAAIDLLQQDVKALVNPKAIALADKKFRPGTFFFLRARNDGTLRSKLISVASRRGVHFEELTSTYPEEERYSTGSENMVPIRKPEIGVYFGDAARPSFSALWYLMEKRFAIPFTPLFSSALSGNLSRYSAIIFPEGSNVPSSDRVREWVNAGGSAIALGDGWVNSAFFKLEKSKLEGAKDPGDLPGGLFKASVDDRSFLSFGYSNFKESPTIIAAPVAGDSFYKAKPEGGNVVTFSEDEKEHRILAGWEWPDDTERALKGAVWLQDQPVGAGHAILFLNDPTERALWPGLNKLTINAILFGSSPRP